MSEPWGSAAAPPRSPRILFLVETYNPSPTVWGGVQVTIRQLVEGLAADGGVAVLAPRLVLPPLPRYRAARAELKEETAQQLLHPPPAGARVLRPPYFHLPLVWPVTEPLQLLFLGLGAALFSVGRPDLLHGHRLYPMGALAVLLGVLLRRPAVVSAYGSQIHTQAHHGPGPLRLWIRFAARRAARVIGVSRDLLERTAALGVGEDRLRFVPSGVDLERFVPRDRMAMRAELGMPAEGRVLLCTSQFLPVKGHAVLVEAFGELCRGRDDTLLVLTGDGPLRPAIQDAVRAAGLADRVRFPGLLAYEDVARHVAACDALVLPSRNEGMPLCVIEALACGRPAVCTRVGGTPELVTDERYGLLVPPDDSPALAAALGAALDRGWDEAALRARAEEFGWARVGERLREVYREVAPA